MNESEMVEFTDVYTNDQTIAIIRVIDGNVALCFSQHENGDMEVNLSLIDCKNLVEALQKAIRLAGTRSS